MDIILDFIEARVLGSLIEKELATPEYYPLSLIALTNACNQKTNRYPVLSLEDDEVMRALQSLKVKRLVGQSDASRVPKYWHDFTKHNNLIRREAALVCLLLLRGPQTSGELRSRTERLCAFDKPEDVLQYLDNLMEIGYVGKLPRQAGQKEQRFGHLFSGDPQEREQNLSRQEPVPELVEDEENRIRKLEETVAMLKEEIDLLKNEFISFKKEFV